MHAKVFVKGISGRRTVKIIAAILAVFIAGSSIAGCSAPWGENSGKGLAKVVFMMSWAPDTNHIGVFVAREKGYYAKLGLDVDILAASQTGAEQSVSGGGADFTLSSMANVADANIKDGQLSLIMQVQQKTSAIWCSLASNKEIGRAHV